jgi:hypothetical protein
MTRSILASVADAVRRTVATIGVIAAAYRNGSIILILPGYGATAANEVPEALRVSVSKLNIKNCESIAANHVTPSVAVVTGCVQHGLARVHLLTHALSTIKDAATAGGEPRGECKYRVLVQLCIGWG